jgi:hypothetical protein
MKNRIIILPLLAALGALLVGLPLIEAANALVAINSNTVVAIGGASVSQSASNSCVSHGPGPISCTSTTSSNPPGQCHTTQTAHSISTSCVYRGR